MVALAKGAATGLLLLLLGYGPLWSLSVINAELAPDVPWSIPLEILFLVGYWTFIGAWRGLPRRFLGPAVQHRLRIPPPRIWLYASPLVLLGSSLAAVVGSSGAYPLISSLLPPGESGLQALYVLSAFSTAALAPAVVEEVSVRGAFQGILEVGLGARAAVLLSSVFFSLLHFPSSVPSLLFYLASGLFLGYLTWLTSSIAPAVTTHFLQNSFVYYMEAYSGVPRFNAGLLAAVSLVLLCLCFALKADLRSISWNRMPPD